MFTLKFYSHDLGRVRIFEAESLTILRDDGSSEITLHQKQGPDFRVDVSSETERGEYEPPAFASVIIENANGKTTEIIHCGPSFKHGGKPVLEEAGKAA